NRAEGLVAPLRPRLAVGAGLRLVVVALRGRGLVVVVAGRGLAVVVALRGRGLVVVVAGRGIAVVAGSRPLRHLLLPLEQDVEHVLRAAELAGLQGDLDLGGLEGVLRRLLEDDVARGQDAGELAPKPTGAAGRLGSALGGEGRGAVHGRR
ncbi:uncharacterized protein LOC125537619, partial [Triticum urartu]|uniref:uncharacterized protein LOC125537619 n=1 Tax=Triticum urartu TaxID=4572 RepID=UPI002043FE9C